MKKTSQGFLEIKNITAGTPDKVIVSGVSLTIKPGELHIIMGPNGSGKSTFTSALMGSPAYTIVNGTVAIDGKNITAASPEERAKAGLMLAFQNPISVPGVSLSNFLRTAYRELHHDDSFSVLTFHKQLLEYAKLLKVPDEFLRRSINDGFSGGEKKKAEMFQLLALKPRYVMLDEIDTGLDVDALKVVAAGINELQDNGCGLLLITHYQRIISYLRPSRVHVLKQGKLVASGGMELVKKIEEKGYAAI